MPTRKKDGCLEFLWPCAPHEWHQIEKKGPQCKFGSWKTNLDDKKKVAEDLKWGNRTRITEETFLNTQSSTGAYMTTKSSLWTNRELSSVRVQKTEETFIPRKWTTYQQKYKHSWKQNKHGPKKTIAIYKKMLQLPKSISFTIFILVTSHIPEPMHTIQWGKIKQTGQFGNIDHVN